jgi:hypothetical protein
MTGSVWLANDVLKLAYEAACIALREQDASLTSVRTRATGLLAAAVVGTSFATGVGLYKSAPGTPTLPSWAAWSLFVMVIIIGSSVMMTLWPVRSWRFGVQPAGLLANAGLDIDEVYTQATRAMVTATEANEATLAIRFGAYRVGVAALIVEVLILIVAVQLT